MPMAARQPSKEAGHVYHLSLAIEPACQTEFVLEIEAVDFCIHCRAFNLASCFVFQYIQYIYIYILNFIPGVPR